MHRLETTKGFQQDADLAYKALAKQLDAKALSGTILWWALEQEIAGDQRTLAKDSLARDVCENVREGWKTGRRYQRQTNRLWEAWRRRFVDRAERVANVKLLTAVQDGGAGRPNLVALGC